MVELVKQLGSWLGAVFAGACCAGASWALAALTAAGAGFLINDAVLIPLFVAMLGLSLWLLYRSARAHANLAPLYLGIAGAVVAVAGLWTWIAAIVIGLAAIVVASFWDFVNVRARRAAG